MSKQESGVNPNILSNDEIYKIGSQLITDEEHEKIQQEALTPPMALGVLIFIRGFVAKGFGDSKEAYNLSLAEAQSGSDRRLVKKAYAYLKNNGFI